VALTRKYIKFTAFSIFIKRRDQLTMGYFDNFDNESLKKYKNKS
jgi:hypothetical protein